MNANQILNSKTAQTAGMVLVGGFVAYFLFTKLGGAIGEGAKKAAAAVGNINAGTPYEGYGVVGTAGNAADKLTGGALSRFGSWLGEAAFNVFNKEYDPNNPNTPAQRKLSYSISPVRPEDKANPLATR